MAKRTVLSLVVAALLSAGCGDDGDDERSARLTRDEYIAAGDRLCHRFLDESSVFSGIDSADELAEAMEELIPVAEDLDREFAELSPPVDAADVHRKLRTALRTSTAKVQEAVDAIRRNDASWERLLDEAVRAGQSSDEAAKAYGFQVCGSEEELSEQQSASS